MGFAFFDYQLALDPVRKGNVPETKPLLQHQVAARGEHRLALTEMAALLDSNLLHEPAQRIAARGFHSGPHSNPHNKQCSNRHDEQDPWNNQRRTARMDCIAIPTFDGACFIATENDAPSSALLTHFVIVPPDLPG